MKYIIQSTSTIALVVIGIIITHVMGQTNSVKLSLHHTLDTGLTSCDLEAGNGFDLRTWGIYEGFVVEEIRLTAQSFPGYDSGPVTVSLYQQDVPFPIMGASWLGTSETVWVGGSTPTEYVIAFDKVTVSQPYLYVVVKFTAATVIKASTTSREGGFSFATGCRESGLAHLSTPITLNDIRLGIDVVGYPVTVQEPTALPTVAEVFVEPTVEWTEIAPTELLSTETPEIENARDVVITESVTTELESEVEATEIIPTEVPSTETPEIEHTPDVFITESVTAEPESEIEVTEIIPTEVLSTETPEIEHTLDVIVTESLIEDMTMEAGDHD